MSKFKKGKSPAFQLYAGDFLSDINVKIMTMSQRGMYITLLLHEWIEGSLPNNEQHIRILCENHPNFEKDWEQVKPRFFEKNGRLYNKRLEEERGNSIAYRERMSANGRKGALKRWQSHSKPIAKPCNIEVEEEVKVEDKKINYNNIYLKEFEQEFWKIYPRKDNKKRAKDKYIMLRKKGVQKEKIIDGLIAYIKQWKENNTEAEFIPMASSWLHQERYDDELIGKAKVVQNLKMQKKEWHYICDGCLKEKTTKHKITTAEDGICDCGEGFFMSKKEYELIKASFKRSDKQHKTRKQENSSLENIHKKEFEDNFKSMMNKIGV